MKKSQWIFLLFSIVLFMQCNNNQPVAHFDNGKVTFIEVVDRYKGLNQQSKEQFKENEDFYRFIRKIAMEKIILQEAKKKGLDRDEVVVNKIDESKKNAAFDLLLEKHIYSKIDINNQDYEKYNRLYEVYQIVKRTDTPDKNRVEQLKNELNQIKQKIKNLDDFKKAAALYSDDVTKEEGGYIGDIRLGIMESVIDDTLKKMEVGTISEVVESTVGLHLFYVNNINQIEIDELINDPELNNLIYEEKMISIEELWYEKLLKDKELKIHYDLIKDEVADEQVVIEYKDKKINRKQFFETVDYYQQGLFPEPTFEEKAKLAENIGLSIILEYLSLSDKIVKSKEYQHKISEEKKYIIINEYISRFSPDELINPSDIAQFYQENKKTLFTFKLDDGSIYVQPMNEVEKFIKDKLKSRFTKESHYSLYRQLVEDFNLKIDENLITPLMKACQG